MKRVLDYVLVRPIGAIINGIVIGLLLPLTTAGQFGGRFGRFWAWLLTPVWIVTIVLAIPISIVFCFVMVMWKGPYWQYPADKRTSFDVAANKTAQLESAANAPTLPANDRPDSP